MIMWIID